jgi:hypothetical protein
MSKAPGLLLLAALACHAAAPPNNTLTRQQKAAGWRLLFDGKSFRGWESPARKVPPGDSWTIENGCLKARARPRIGEDLFTRENFTNFELLFDWRISPGGNSGVKYRIQDRLFVPEMPGKRFEETVELALSKPRLARPPRGYEYVIAFEYQVIDDEKNADARSRPTHQAGALYDMLGASRAAAAPVGRFNHSRIIVKGNHIEHWLNGIKVVDAMLNAPEIAAAVAKRWGSSSQVYALLARQPRKACPISLQNHNDEAWFRNIKIRALK